MNDHPLQPPEADSPLLRRFLAANHIDPAQSPLTVLSQVATAFAGLPFENLTKILKEAQAGRAEEARRFPAEVLAEHWALGTGGTCFALTATLLYLVRALGWPAEPLLADRHYGPDTHSALLVWIDGRPHLLDPGYLIVRPLPLPSVEALHVPTPFNELILKPQGGGARVELHTLQQGNSTYRLTFKAEPAEVGDFLRAWDISFDADMMRYPVLSRIANGQQFYLQKNHLLIRGRTVTQRREVPADDLVEDIACRFSIAPQIAARALEVLRRKGER
jgi:arylamine N-acetyltransferase